jgi:hypothetical protein
MDSGPARLLLVHGGIVLFLGVLTGFPFWLAIIRGWSEERVRAWRVAHAVLIATALTMLVVGALLPQTAAGPQLLTFVSWCLLASGYGFAFAFILGALTLRRGLTPWPLGLGTILFVGHMVGAAGSVLGLGAFLLGLLHA